MEPRQLKLNFGRVEKVDSREEKRDIKTNNTKAGESSGIVRNLKKEAAEKSKNTHLVSEDAVTWLIVNADVRGNVQSLYCMVAKNMPHKLKACATSHSNGHIKVV